MIALKDDSAQAVRGDYCASLDGVRALAFLAVFLFHANSGRFAAGALGVPVFFVLSGFLITRILLRNEGSSLASDLRTFYIRRGLRILPLYYLVVVLLHVLGRLEQPWLTYLHVYNLGIYAQGQFIGCYGHFWTLAVEEQFYLIFPLILLATPARLRGLVLIGLMGLCAASRHILDLLSPSPFTSVLPNVAGEYLVAGSIAGWLDNRRAGIAFSRVRFGAAIAAAAWVALRYGRSTGGSLLLGRMVPDIAAVAFAVVIWEVWRAKGLLARTLSARPLAYLGRISYGCYVYHAFALLVIERGLRSVGATDGSVALKLRTPLALLATMIVATLSWHLLESPILRLKDRFGHGPRRHRPAAIRAATPRRSDAAAA